MGSLRVFYLLLHLIYLQLDTPVNSDEIAQTVSSLNHLINKISSQGLTSINGDLGEETLPREEKETYRYFPSSGISSFFNGKANQQEGIHYLNFKSSPWVDYNCENIPNILAILLKFVDTIYKNGNRLNSKYPPNYSPRMHNLFIPLSTTSDKQQENSQFGFNPYNLTLEETDEERIAKELQRLFNAKEPLEIDIGRFHISKATDPTLTKAKLPVTLKIHEQHFVSDEDENSHGHDVTPNGPKTFVLFISGFNLNYKTPIVMNRQKEEPYSDSSIIFDMPLAEKLTYLETNSGSVENTDEPNPVNFDYVHSTPVSEYGIVLDSNQPQMEFSNDLVETISNSKETFTQPPKRFYALKDNFSPSESPLTLHPSFLLENEGDSAATSLTSEQEGRKVVSPSGRRSILCKNKPVGIRTNAGREPM